MMKIKFFEKSMFFFIMIGLLNTLISAFFMFLLEDLGYWFSTSIAYIIGAVLSFFLNRYITFRSNEKLLKSAIKFIIGVSVCYFLAYSLAQPAVKVILNFTDISYIWQERVAKIFGMIFYTVLNYFGQRFFAFAVSKKN